MQRGAVALIVCLGLLGCKTRLLDPRLEDSDASLHTDASPDLFDMAFRPCNPGPIAVVRATPTIMFVLDRSGSMGQGFGPLGSRWQSLTQGLSLALPSVDQAMVIGALMFPSSGGGAQTCSVPQTANLAPQLGNVTPMINLMRATQPSGSTPTSDAMTVAANQLLAVRAATSARALVLATDGAPCCNTALNPLLCVCAAPTTGGRCTSAIRCLDDVRTVDTIAGLAKKGLPTYVIGIQSAEAQQFVATLNAMAVAGGRPRPGTGDRYYAANSDSELQAALVSIRDQVGDCDYLLSGVPSIGEVVISLNGNVIPFDPSGMEGWTWRDQSNGEVVIVGQSCQDAIAAGITIDAQAICPPAE